MKAIRIVFYLLLIGIVISSNSFGWSLKDAAKPFKGQTIRLIGEAYAPWEAYQKMKGEFEKITGIKVVMEATDHKTVIDKTTADFVGKTSIYDAFALPYYEIGKYAENGWVVETKDLMRLNGVQNPDFNPQQDLHPDVWKSSSEWKGKYYGITYQFIPPFMCYRKDIADNQQERKAFEAKYGYKMPIPPVTYTQLIDLMQFFTRKKGETLAGTKLKHNFYGTVIALKRHVATWYDYQKILNAMGGRLITQKGKVASDFMVNIKALEYMISLMQYSPPGVLEYGWDEEYTDMAAGLVFTYQSWPDTFPYLENPEESKVAGKLGYFLPPDYNTVVSETHNWCISSISKRKAAVWLWLQWVSSYDVQKRWHLNGGATVRPDVMKDPEVYKIPYMPTVLESLDHLFIGPKIPQIGEVNDITIQAIMKAGLKEFSPKDALSWAAKNQRKIINK